MNLHLQTVPAGQGLAWIRHGLTVFRRRPLQLSSLGSFTIMLMLVLPMVVPPLGVLSLLLPPIIWLGFMLAAHEVLQGQTPKAGVFLMPLRLTAQRRKSQLMMCLIYGLIQLVVSLAVSALFADSFKALSDLKATPDPDEAAFIAAFSDRELLKGALAVFGAKAVFSLPFLLAPALVHWGGQGVPQALFSSFLALWRNRGAVLISVLTALGLFFAISIVAPLFSLVTPLLGMLALTFSFIALVAILGCSLYFGFVDCFLSGTPDKLDLQPPAPEVKSD